MTYTPPLATPYRLAPAFTRLLAELRREVQTGTVEHRDQNEGDAAYMQTPTQLRLLEAT